VRESGGTLLTGPQVVRKGVMGTPVAFMEAMVLDPQDKPCEVGQPGELALRPKLPHLVLSEYIGKPEATVKAWRNLWFHTGDAAVLQPDGMFDFVDRLGDRIRVRGENLSSFQVEDLINQHPKVQMSAVLSVPSAEGDEDAIAAFVLPVEGEDLEEAQLRQFADTSMPKYMRPTHIRIVAEIPRTPTNKVEKYKLRAQLIAQIQSEAKQT
jgi:crotonobetaine/carnitine-CoA ligase